MPSKPNPPNPDKDRPAFLRSVLLDPTSTQAEREAAMREYDKLLGSLPSPAADPPQPVRPAARAEDFLPRGDEPRTSTKSDTYVSPWRRPEKAGAEADRPLSEPRKA